MIGTFNPNMVILARVARGISPADLAQKIGMSATNLSKIERNDIGIQDEVLEVNERQTPEKITAKVKRL